MVLVSVQVVRGVVTVKNSWFRFLDARVSVIFLTGRAYTRLVKVDLGPFATVC